MPKPVTEDAVWRGELESPRVAVPNSNAVSQARQRVLFIGPCDRGGISTVNQQVRNLVGRSQLFESHSINTTPWRQISPLVGYPILYLITAWTLLRRRFDLAYLQVSQTGFIHQSIFLLIAKMAGCRTIAHFHAKPSVSSTLSPRALGRLMGTQRYIDQLIVLAESSKRDLEQHGWKKPIDVIPNFLEASAYPQDRLPLEKREYLLYFGRMEENKGIYKVLELARHLPEEQFVFIGPFANSRLERAFASQALPFPNVRWLGPIYGDGKIAHLQRAKALVFPSETEVFPMTLIESALCGVVPFATPVGLVGSLIRPGINGFFIDADAPDQTARVIRELLADPNRYETVARNWHDAARQRFTAAVVGPRLISILRGESATRPGENHAD